MKTLPLLLVTLSSVMVFGQNSGTQKPSNPYAQAADILKGSEVTPSAPTPAKAVTPRRKGKATATEPKDAEPGFTGVIARREVVLPASAKVGLALAETIKTTGTPPVSSPDGRILFAYGHSFPVVVCSTFQICQIELQPGETPSKDAIDIGDNRFNIAMRQAGNGPQQFHYVVVKPTEAGLDTSLSIGTSERSYYLRVISTDRANMPRVAFSYPDDEARKSKEAETARKLEMDRLKAEAEQATKAAAEVPVFRNRNYTVEVKGKDAEWLRPLSVADDGVQHTRIDLTASAKSRGLPVVVISDSRGPIPSNPHWDNTTLVVDAIFEHACLLSGVGRHQQRACITNEGIK